MKNKFKITPEMRKTIENIAILLPQMQKVGPGGIPRVRKITKFVLGKDMPEGTKIQGDGEVDPTKSYTHIILEPIYLNHLVNLNEVYLKDGMAGIKVYTEFIISENKAKMEEMGNNKELLEKLITQ